ncbi:hypothetical protein HAV15_012152 [Penicillium sp. str. |nr:hypothetical protein HAV15_012152 [Penicillium sp. str. \
MSKAKEEKLGIETGKNAGSNCRFRPLHLGLEMHQKKVLATRPISHTYREIRSAGRIDRSYRSK